MFGAERDPAGRRRGRALVLTLGLATVLGCGGGGGGSPREPPNPVPDRSLRLSAEPPSIAGSQVATISVQALGAGGQPVPAGTAVTLQTDRGVLGTTVLSCDAQGSASTTLRTAGALGTAWVTASVAGITTSTPVTLRPPYELQLWADPPTIDSAGSARINVQVTALDPTAAVDSRPMRLESSLGRVNPTNPRTDDNGLATSCLFAEGASGVAALTASMGGADPVTTTVVLRRSQHAAATAGARRACSR